MPYGYVYSGNKKAEKGIGIYQPDSDAAEVIKKIFLLVADGNAPVNIAKCLNDEGIPTLGVYKNQTRNYGYQMKNAKSNLWVGGKVRDILQNEVYIGTYICHKISTTRPRESSWNDETEYLRFENAHEAIVSNKFLKLPKNPYKFEGKEGHIKGRRTAMHCKERLNVSVVDIP